MNLEDVLINCDGRLSCDSKWLVWDEFMHWTVYEHIPYAKQTTCLISTPNLKKAIDELVKEIEDEQKV